MFKFLLQLYTQIITSFSGFFREIIIQSKNSKLKFATNFLFIGLTSYVTSLFLSIIIFVLLEYFKVPVININLLIHLIALSLSFISLAVIIINKSTCNNLPEIYSNLLLFNYYLKSKRSISIILLLYFVLSIVLFLILSLILFAINFTDLQKIIYLTTILIFSFSLCFLIIYFGKKNELKFEIRKLVLQILLSLIPFIISIIGLYAKLKNDSEQLLVELTVLACSFISLLITLFIKGRKTYKLFINEFSQEIKNFWIEQNSKNHLSEIVKALLNYKLYFRLFKIKITSIKNKFLYWNLFLVLVSIIIAVGIYYLFLLITVLIEYIINKINLSAFFSETVAQYLMLLVFMFIPFLLFIRLIRNFRNRTTISKLTSFGGLLFFLSFLSILLQKLFFNSCSFIIYLAIFFFWISILLFAVISFIEWKQKKYKKEVSEIFNEIL